MIIDVFFLQLLVCRLLRNMDPDNNGSAYDWFVVFVINRLNPPCVFFVSSWTLSIDYDWFSRLRTILYQHVMTYCTRIMHVFRVRATWNKKYQIAIIIHVFQWYSVLRDVNSVQWLISPSEKYRYIQMHLLLHGPLWKKSSLRSDNRGWYSLKLSRVKWVRFSARKYLVTYSLLHLIFLYFFMIVSRLKTVRTQIMQDHAKVVNFNVFVDSFTLIITFRHEG